ncbi:hypothetical protein ACFV3R_08880 [Streptomyces sp. NPDC059740]|uniref:hypothetical protein n=1 Tax=Streptomyces sp. NPDC059740 TaxID=3346926 RepID=UPI00365EAE44
MSDTTPSQAEGERDDVTEAVRGHYDESGKAAEQTPRTTPSQAEGDRDDESGS